MSIPIFSEGVVFPETEFNWGTKAAGGMIATITQQNRKALQKGVFSCAFYRREFLKRYL